MTKNVSIITVICSLLISSTINANEDSRQYVKLPEIMQQHMMSNMRDHLSSDKLDEAAEIAESRLGMTSLKLHNASHMAKFMPEGMQQAGTNMHRAASRFALKAQEGDLLPAYYALTEITSACVACHSGYRLR